MIILQTSSLADARVNVELLSVYFEASQLLLGGKCFTPPLTKHLLGSDMEPGALLIFTPSPAGVVTLA